MKFSRSVVFVALCVCCLAVFPKVEVDSGAYGSDLVTIQDNRPGTVHGVSAQDDLDSPDSQVSHDALHSFVLSISMIIVSEIGDKTFLVAAIMAMRYRRQQVFFAAFSALALMTILSGLLGHVLPTLLSRRVTQFCASLLFLIFGTKLLIDGLGTSKDLGVQGEMNEVEEEISAGNINNRGSEMENGVNIDLDMGSDQGAGFFEPSPVKQVMINFTERFKQISKYIFSPAWIQTFLMTFLGEWGDRSQIATIALAAGSDYIMVILGGVIGHGFCTGMAVIGGQYLASKISVRTVLLGGSVAFYLFALTYLYSAYYDIE
ncbi:hypothetical protein FOA43_001029 [Brettanomyces nanus]|uniref:GDT1 family protein n=1 Tax=Eeniella nana TaxID=13502 RepID=A0A875RXE2_EENNA|nr:uncharacterized protein FOA43_001029 [Brettanomyces nanus]QPG73716.1 hypothetical protein FOA43_001029 [Brettanomyces nanus]